MPADVLGLAVEITQLKSDVDGLKTDLAGWKKDYAATLASLAVKLDEVGKARQITLQSLAPIGGLVSLGVAFLSLFVSHQMGPVAASVGEVQRDVISINQRIEKLLLWQVDVTKDLQTNSAVDATATDDRESKGRAIEKMSDIIKENTSDIKALRSDSCEMETQIAADLVVRAIQEQAQQRMNALLYRDAKNEELPSVGIPVSGISRERHRC